MIDGLRGVAASLSPRRTAFRIAVLRVRDDPEIRVMLDEFFTSHFSQKTGNAP